MAALLADSYVHFAVADIAVPFASSYKRLLGAWACWPGGCSAAVLATL